MDFELPKNFSEQLRWSRFYEGIRPQVEMIVDIHAAEAGIEPASKEVQKFYDKTLGDDKLFRVLCKVSMWQYKGFFSVRRPYNKPTWNDIVEAFKEVEMEDVAAGKLSRLENGASLNGAESSILSSSAPALGEGHEGNKKTNNQQLRLPQSTES